MLSSVAVIPARYGSKRVPHKNFRDLCGKPLLAYTIEQALRSKRLNRIVVSTDCTEIETYLRGYDSERVTAHMRSESLSGDLVSTEEVLVDVLDQEWAAGVEAVVTLPPTTPFRSAETIDACIELFEANRADSVLAICRRKIRMGTFDPDTREFDLSMKNPPARMSKWPLTSFDNSSVYVTRSGVLRETGLILGEKTFAVETDEIQGHDINTPIDWAIAETLVEKGFVSNHGWLNN